MVYLIPKKAMNRVVAHHSDTQDAIKDKTNEVERKAKALLSSARALTPHSKIIGPDHLTFVDSDYAAPDGFINLNAPNAMAIDFGHSPSGWFAGTDTKSPEGLYILWRAAIFGSPS